MADSDINLETILEQLEFNYGGVLQKLARLHDTVVEQMEVLKTAGVKIRRKSTTYATGTVLVCVGKNNGNKRLKCKSGGTTSDATWTEATYNSLVIGNTYSDGTVTWEVMEEAFTSSSIVWSALNASHAEIADYASSAHIADYALSAGYAGPFQVVNLGEAESSGSLTPGGEIVTSTGINYEVVDTTRNWGIQSKAGVIINGKDTIPVPYNSGFLPLGETLYLWGSSGQGGEQFKFGWNQTGTPGENEFITALARNAGGQVKQIQFGDIVTPWPGEENVEEYQGPFKMFITGSSTEGQTTKYSFEIYDPTSPINQSTNKHEWAGKIFAGQNYHQAGITSGSLNVGDFVYLVGDYKNGAASFAYTNYIPEITPDGEDSAQGRKTITSAGFYVRLAQCHAGSATQIQHGDITVPPWKVTSADSATSATEAAHALTADYASSAGYVGPFHVVTIGSTVIPGEQEGETTTNFKVKVDDDTRGINDAGAVVYGSNTFIATWSDNTSATLTEGQKLYLVGTSDTSGTALGFSIGITPSPTPGQFWTQLAYNSGGRVLQTQFGDVVEPWPVSVPAPPDISSYIGPFFASGGEHGENNEVVVTICDLTDSRQSPQTPIAGKVFDGVALHEVASASMTIQDGAFVYLNGTRAQTGVITLQLQNTAGTNTSSSFTLKVAKNNGGVIEQIQYGDVYSIPWSSFHAQEAESATSAGFADSATFAASAGFAEYHGPFHVSKYEGDIVKIFDDTNPGQNKAGAIIIGESTYYPVSSSITLNNGFRLYLVGTSTLNGIVTEYQQYQEGIPIVSEGGKFYVPLAIKINNNVIQQQFGNIIEPLFEGGSEYEGPFKVEIIGSTEGEGNITTYDVSILDPTDSSTPQKAGRVFNGWSSFDILSSSINTNDGDFIYLRTSYSVSQDSTFFNFTTTSGVQTPIRTYTRLAKNEGGKIIQIQHGDIVIPEFTWSSYHASSAIHASTADFASSTEYIGPFHVSSTGSDTVKIFDDTNPNQNRGGTVVIGSSNYYPGSSSVNLYEGYRLYLVGTSAAGNVTFQYSQYQDGTSISPASNQFYAPLAVRINNKILQTQFGNIIQPILGGTSGETYEYNGPFKVSVTGTTEGTNIIDVDITDPTDTSIPQKAGRVFDGAILHTLSSTSLSNIPDGAFIYLNGTSGTTPSISTTSGNNNTSQFSVRIAQNSGGKVLQMLFGDIYSVPWNATNGGVQKIIAGPGTEISPASGTGEVTISCTITGGTSVLPVDWDGGELLSAGNSALYWTGDPSETPTDYQAIGHGLGGIIAGQIQGPSNISSYADYDDGAWSYRFQIEINPGGSLSYIIPLLHPKKTEVEVGDSSGYCYTPRHTGVWINIPINTEFRLNEVFLDDIVAAGATHSLVFYPYWFGQQS